MRILDLFAGIGGFSLAAHWVGWETAAFVEWDKFCQKVLAKNFPDVPIYGDIKDFHYEQEKKQIGPIDLICGGFPCQPFSHAGKRRGKADDRYLWPEMLRVIREVRPAWVVGENVAGLLSMDGGSVFEEVCASLENEGYAVESFVIPACAVGAPHRRDRVWIVAHHIEQRRRSEPQRGNARMDGGVLEVQEWEESAIGREAHHRTPLFNPDSESPKREQPRRTRAGREGFTDDVVGVPRNPDKQRLEGRRKHGERSGERIIGETGGEFEANPDTNGGGRDEGQGRAEWPHADTWKEDRRGQWREHWHEAATRLCRVHDGIPRRVDRPKQLKALGNAIVPQVAYEIFRAINETNA